MDLKTLLMLRMTKSLENDAESNKIAELCRPYLVSTGIENGIKYIFCANPLMTETLSKSKFVDADIRTRLGI